MECQGDGFQGLFLCYGHWAVVGYRVACVGARRVIGSLGHWVYRAAMGLYRAIVGLYGLEKWGLGYDNTSKYIYLACFSLAIE